MKTKTLLYRMSEYICARIDAGICDPEEYRVVADAADGLRRASVFGRYDKAGLLSVIKLADFDLRRFEAEQINNAPQMLEIGPFRYRRELGPGVEDQHRVLKNRLRHLTRVLRHAERAGWAGR